MTPCRITRCWFGLYEFRWARLAVSVGFLYNGLDPSGPYNPSSISSVGFSKLSQTFGFGSLDLFPSVTGWNLSDDNWDSHQSDYRRWPVQTRCPRLLGVLAGVILVDSQEFPLHKVSIWLWNAPQIFGCPNLGERFPEDNRTVIHTQVWITTALPIKGGSSFPKGNSKV